MSHCVPDWDGHGGELDSIIATTDYLPPVKEKWGSSLFPKGSPASDLASPQTSDVPSGWTENAQVAPKPDAHRVKAPDWEVNCNTWTTARPGIEDAITPSKPPSSEPPPAVISNGVLAVNVPVLDPTMTTSMMADDEMVSWLQYPLDDTLERSYCSDFFGRLPNAVNSMQAIKDSLAVGQTTAAGRPNCRILPTVPCGTNGSLSRAVSADAAMAMGAGRAAGVLPQAGVEVFTRVRTQQPYPGKWSPSSTALANPAKASTSTAPDQQPLQVGGATSGVPNISSSMLLPPPKAQPGPVQCAALKKGPINFSHFSMPGVNMKASLQCLGMTHATPAQNRARTAYLHPNMANNGGARPFDPAASSGSSIAESTTTRLHSEDASMNDPHVRGAAEGQQPSLATESSWPSSLPNSLASADAEANSIAGNQVANSTAGNHVDRIESKPADQDEAVPPAEPEDRETSNDRSNGAAAPSTAAAVTPPARSTEPPEPTLTSSSGGSGNTSKGVVGSRGKRRTREQEDSEIQSDDAEDEVVELKKPQQRTNPSKRTRAAEVHNLSERRRRDRINEKMKALQELIPNSNKADKASMLDEAIEYLKMLQIQLQVLIRKFGSLLPKITSEPEMMSMRSGMSIPSLIPNGMQQVPSMGVMPGMGMGMGLGMVGMGGMSHMSPMGHVLDMNLAAAAGHASHLMPRMPAHPHAHGHGGGASHTGSPLMPHHQMPGHGGASYNVSQVMSQHPSHGGPSHTTTVSATSPAVSMVDSQDLRLPSNTASALESVYLARQHPLQLTPQVDLHYSASTRLF